jgi:hypothetical protein
MSDWCDVCNAPQMVMPDGEHRCGELASAKWIPAICECGHVETEDEHEYNKDCKCGGRWIPVVSMGQEESLGAMIARHETTIAHEQISVPDCIADERKLHARAMKVVEEWERRVAKLRKRHPAINIPVADRLQTCVDALRKLLGELQ